MKARLSGLKKFVLIALAAGTLFGASTAVASSIRDKDLQSNDQISFIAETLGANMEFVLKDFTGQYSVLPHNNGEPIYVSISDELANSKYKNIIVNQLDNVFGIASDINPLYTYKLVSKDECIKQKLLCKTVIEFENKDLSSFLNNDSLRTTALAKRNMNLLNLFSGRYENGSNKIYLDVNLFEEQNYSENKIKYFNMHELCHVVFGFDDVYKNLNNVFSHAIDYSGVTRYDTIMQTTNRDNSLLMLTPDDYTRVVSVLAEKMYGDLSKEKILKLYGKKIEAYKNLYYEKINEYLLEGLEKESAGNAKDISNLVNNTSYVTDDDKSTSYKYDLKLNGDKYIFDVYREGELIDSSEGEVVHTKDFTILRNVNFVNGFGPTYSEYRSVEDVQDVAVFKDNGPYAYMTIFDGRRSYFDNVVKTKVDDNEFSIN